ncbi:hypothetical protein CBS63078_7215 [Aspergillus niger]|nr:hypothetical protein CBS115989_8345 [Aspergillus niger]KAI2826835.1 hypothetical protein CBS133816_7084 [Aspergillus niger]KAI2847524.1 hypothetical protein CBS11350_3050 [Aspergillus niger]KAI2847727.1 hypothetical protein CBS11232_7072 [Aspergillus niger]KAI2859373.1 hypothetical protein CBS12448_5749 [Aspergillus niger]
MEQSKHASNCHHRFTTLILINYVIYKCLTQISRTCTSLEPENRPEQGYHVIIQDKMGSGYTELPTG